MKRLVWLVIFVFGTALAQVSPLDLGNQHHKACSCCETPGDCGMPGCELPVACALNNNFVCESTDRTSAEMALKEVEELNGVAAFSALETVSSLLAHPVCFPKIARAPLFKVHCSFVI